MCDVRSHPAEGPRCRDGVLTWVDIEGRALHRWDGSHSAGCGLGTMALDERPGAGVAVYGGGHVERWTPDGALDRVVRLSAENPTPCCFGGSTLDVTTGPGDGRVYVYEAGVTGPPSRLFRRTAPSDADVTSAR